MRRTSLQEANHVQSTADKSETFESHGRKVFRRHLRLRFGLGFGLALLLFVCWTITGWNGTTYALLAPGPLSNPHAQIWQGTARSETCLNCHPHLSKEPLADFADTVAQKEATPRLTRQKIHPGMSQSEACARCHSDNLNDLLRGTPHDLPLESLTKMKQTGSMESSKFVSQSDIHTDWQHRSFACSDCHIEHQGRFVSLQAMDNSRCQACHQKRFDSFEGSHSEFTEYPVASSSATIAFNHRSHASKHFPKEKAAFDCNQCHLAEDKAGRRLVKITSFENACASCHQQPLSSSLQDGVVLWQLPSVDLEQIVALDSTTFATWPESASSVNDLALSPLMRKLLIQELQTHQDDVSQLAALRVSTIKNIDELSTDLERGAAMVAVVAAAAKNILAEVSEYGQSALATRLRKLNVEEAQDQFDRRLVEELVKGVPPDIFNEAFRSWFLPNSLESKGSSSSSNVTNPFLPELMAPQPLPSETKVPRFTSTTQAPDEDLMSNEDLLAEEPFGEIDRKPTEGSNPEDALPREYNAREHLSNGGWMIDRVRNAIVYIPSGHADRWMQAYAEWLLQSNSPRDRRLDSMNVTSRCLECHIAPTNRDSLPNADMALTSAWRSKPIDASARKLTRFDHQPHLTLPQLRDCEACHQMTELAQPKSALVSTDSTQSQLERQMNHAGSEQDFHYLSKKMCVQCHNKQTMVQDCTMCHDYHVSTRSTLTAENKSILSTIQ